MHYVHAKTLLSAQNGMNLYRGCTHGCIYCDSRSVCYHIDHALKTSRSSRTRSFCWKTRCGASGRNA